jgi:VIT1/CCC1 family predicted Fe2+/Mn2+ transporter
MKASWKTGLSFGLTSGVITTLGLMVGLHAGTHSRAVVLGGILTIAVADALSDAMGMHLAEESKNSGPASHVWEATLATFAAKFVIAGSFVVPVLTRPLDQAIVISIVWGLFLLTALSVFVARAQSIAPWKVIGEHLIIALCVVAITHVVGDWVRGFVEAE